MLRAAWLGHWKAPWGLDRGRRWGDPAWALAAISQAWLLGGREGRWPRLSLEGRWPQGPRVAIAPAEFDPRPLATWVAQLRHGSARAAADRRGAREDEALAWAWEALLAGDGAPWMAAGSLLLDLPTRLRWVAVLGVVTMDGTLCLPPYLEDLVPESLRKLPRGWWEFLLRAQDAEGRLLPEGDLDPSLPWPLLQPLAQALTLPNPPGGQEAWPQAPWWCQRNGFGGVLDPRLRAWSRGWGASAKGLLPLLPATLALAASPDATLGALLQMQVPPGLPDAWRASLSADFQELLTPPPLPAPSGNPTLDRLRMRWGGEEAPPAPGYPPWGTRAHPCADPFHWMAQGRCHSLASNPEAALRAFTLAHGHFQRLRASAWAQRAASNAATMALAWADLPAYRRWSALRGPLPPHWLALEAAYLSELYAEPDQAQSQFLALVAAFPDFAPAWEALASFGANQERWDLVRQALPHCQGRPLAVFLEAALGPPDRLDRPAPDGTEPETRVTWEAHRLLRGKGDAPRFWQAWEACPNQFLRLDLGLRVLERRLDLREVGRLLALQAIADRAASPGHLQRLAALWPKAGGTPEQGPRELLGIWLAQQPCPHWLAWPEGQGMGTLGAGEAPPEGALGRLVQEGTLAPFRAGAWIWQGHALFWEGSPVGGLLQALPADAPPAPPVTPRLLAPWVARLRQAAPILTFPETGLLLTDGSEPMAALLRELDRVAPSDLPVLLLGPTGSGKELAAREVHQRSGRSGPLVAVNCSAFAESLLESELFGHTKGAFTGANQDRRGAIEAARGGTLFLDEVADLSPRLQSLLLRVLQEREIRRVGSDHAVKVDVRFAAATHRPLEELAESGAFRRDLFFRLQGAVVRLPPLCARRHEFPFLLPRLAVRAAEATKRPVPALAPGLPQALARLPWPGNVRELLHALERAILRCEDGLLKPRHFPELETPMPEDRTWEDATHAFQRRLLLDTLQACRFRVAEAAKSLGLARPALYATAKRLGVDLVAERMGLRSPD